MKIDVTNAFSWRRPRVSRARWPPDSVPCRLSVIGEKPRVRRANNGTSLIPLQYPLTTTKCPMRLHSYWSQVTVSQEILLINRSSQPRGTYHRCELVKQKAPSILYMMRESTSEGFHWTWKESSLWFRATNYKEPKVTMFPDTFNVSQFHVCKSYDVAVIIIVYKLMWWGWRRGEERIIGEGLAYHLEEDDLLLN